MILDGSGRTTDFDGVFGMAPKAEAGREQTASDSAGNFELERARAIRLIGGWPELNK